MSTANEILPAGTYKIGFFGTTVVEEVTVKRVVFSIREEPIVVVAELRRSPGVTVRIPWTAILLAYEVKLDPAPEGDGEVRNVPAASEEG